VADRVVRVVVVAPVLPYDAIPHAGGVYLRHLHRALVDQGAQVTFLVTQAPNADQAVGQPGAPSRVVLLGSARRRTLPRRALMRLAYKVDGWVRRWEPTKPPLAFSVQLLTTREARAALRDADVIDLHWPEYARLVGLVRRINPRARIVATLHDVMSQRWDRATTGAPADELALARRASAAARRLEKATLRRADAVVVFSDKDRDLLDAATRTGTVEVLMPPLAARAAARPLERQGGPTALFVSLLARRENDDAAHWLVTEIWPSVAVRVPTARLRLVGNGASARLLDACAHRSDVDLVGFVDDLSAEYGQATLCVVPLRLGAGVKFKTVEALVAGVPTVTTYVGAEGVAGPEHFACVSDDAAGLADAIARVLTDPAAFDSQARATQQWVREQYGEAQFHRQVSRVYGLGGRAS
jgi:glycosyltransferase involved in cell wall biosynthesis